MLATALFIIDPPERLDLATDTTLAIMRESRCRGQKIYYTTLSGLALANGTPWARAAEAIFARGRELFSPGPMIDLDLSRTIQVVWMRKDPPVDLEYLHATLVLDRLPDRVVQINPASALQRHCEKLLPSLFPGLQPATLTSAAPELLAQFTSRHGRVVVKPLNDCSGRSVVFLDGDCGDLVHRLGELTHGGRRFVQAQHFLPEIVDGDIRVLLLNGEPIGQVRRVPAAGEFRSNVNAGGHCEPCVLAPDQLAICRRVGPWLRAQSIHLAGIDIVGKQVLEVNITSPSCLREINLLYGARLEEKILDFVETCLSLAG